MYIVYFKHVFVYRPFGDLCYKAIPRRQNNTQNRPYSRQGLSYDLTLTHDSSGQPKSIQRNQHTDLFSRFSTTHTRDQDLWPFGAVVKIQRKANNPSAQNAPPPPLGALRQLPHFASRSYATDLN